jgi:hypothetical protein
MAFSMDDLETLRRDLAQLPPNRPKIVSKHDAVAALTSELVAAQRLGYSVEELAELLSAKGLAMTPGTLRGYLRRTRKKRPAPKKVAAVSARADSATATASRAEHPVAPRPRSTPPAPAPSLPPPAPALRSDANGPARPADAPVGRGMARPTVEPPAGVRGSGGS